MLLLTHSYIHMSERDKKGLKKNLFTHGNRKKMRAQDDEWERSLSPNRYFTFNTFP